MWKFIILIALIVAGYFLVMKLQQKNKSKKNNELSDLVTCSKCGTLTVETEMISHHGKLFCSKKCAGL
jgi:preprotein translocase subunit YajC